MTHHHGHEAHHRALDLDAEVFGAQLTQVLDRLGDLTPRRVVDLGAGTGAGTRLLRERYPDATVTAVDNDPRALDVLRQQGFAVLQADLDAGFPQVADVDLVWAASSLHHVADPAGLLAGARAALAPGGTLVVVEVEGLPAFTGHPAEERGRAAALASGWNHHPDWTPVLQAAGFSVTRTDTTLQAPSSAAAQEYARTWLPRYLHVPGLAGQDRRALTELLDDLPGAEPRATRAVWIAEVDR
ncbi:class I SAM-dependent methyltransferase [Kineococcus sp. SYSU DK003]|uniref:class I SAM-dependent methyltransferase n=1 Tax=Kineococcus sp. SYSU DK003 TaxID=3383124 RepID=UPI003D7C6ABD